MANLTVNLLSKNLSMTEMINVKKPIKHTFRIHVNKCKSFLFMIFEKLGEEFEFIYNNSADQQK